jgi:hypothetical protein
MGPISSSVCNCQAFPTYSRVTLCLIGPMRELRSKVKCCEYGTWPLFYTDFTPVNPEKSFIALVPGFSQGETSRESLKSSNDEETLVTRIKKC